MILSVNKLKSWVTFILRRITWTILFEACFQERIAPLRQHVLRGLSSRMNFITYYIWYRTVYTTAPIFQQLAVTYVPRKIRNLCVSAAYYWKLIIIRNIPHIMDMCWAYIVINNIIYDWVPQTYLKFCSHRIFLTLHSIILTSASSSSLSWCHRGSMIEQRFVFFMILLDVITSHPSPLPFWNIVKSLDLPVSSQVKLTHPILGMESKKSLVFIW